MRAPIVAPQESEGTGPCCPVKAAVRRETCRRVREAGRSVLVVEADVSSPEECRRLVRATVGRFGRIDLSREALEHMCEGAAIVDTSSIQAFDPTPAPAFVFLASDESRFLTGEVVGVIGGRRLV